MSALATLVLGAFVLMAATVAFAESLPRPSLLTAAFGGLGLLVAGCLVTWSAVAWRTRAPVSVARAVPCPRPQGLVEGAELLDAGSSPTPSPPNGSPGSSPAPASGMVAAHAASLADLLDATDPETLVALAPARHRALGVAAVTAIGMLFASQSAWVEERIAGLMAEPRALDQGPAREQLRDALVGDIDYVLTLPAYTELAARRIRNSDGDVSALIGTRVQLATRALARVAAASLRFEGDEQTVQLTVGEDGQSLSGDFTVQRSGAFRFQLTSLDEGLLLERHAHRVVATEDRPPTIDLIEPPDDLELEELAPFSVVYRALDDFGLARVDVLVRKLEPAAPAPEPQDPAPSAAGGPTRKRVASLSGESSHLSTLTVDPTEYELVAGEVLVVSLEVRDGNTIATRPGTGRSRELRVRLHSPAERHSENVAAERALLDAMVNLLGDRLEAPLHASRHPFGRSGPPPRFEAMVAGQTQVHRGATSLLEQLEAVEEGLSRDSLAVGTDTDAIRDMRRRYAGHHDQERRAVTAALETIDEAERPPVLELLTHSNDRGIQELEADIPLLERLLTEEAERSVRDEARELVNAQAGLRELLERAAAAKDKDELRAELLQRLLDMRATLAAMRPRLAESARPMPFENANMDAMSGIEEMSDVASGIDNLMELVRQGRMDEALAAVEKLGQAVQGLSSKMDEVLDSPTGASGGAGTLALRSLGGELDKLRSVEAELKESAAAEHAAEQGAGDEEQSGGPDGEVGPTPQRPKPTEPSSNEAPATAEGPGRGGSGDTLKKQRAARTRLDELQEELRKVDGQRPGSEAQLKPSLEAARRAMAAAEEALEQQEPGRASDEMGHAEDALRAAGDVVRRETEGHDGTSQAPGANVSRRPVEIPSADRYRVPKEFREELLRSHKETAPPSYRGLVDRYYEALIR